MYSFTFSDTAITDRHSDTTIFQLRAHWVRISWSTGSEKSFGHVPPVGVEPRLPACEASTLSTRPGSLLNTALKTGVVLYKEDYLPKCHSSGELEYTHDAVLPVMQFCRSISKLKLFIHCTVL